MKANLAQQAELLRSLHHDSRPLMLPNAWDVSSARAVEAAGFPVVATSSYAVADSLGLADDDSMPPSMAFGAVGRVATAVSVPVTADIEAGYQLSPVELVAALLGAGAVGCNLEDGDHHGSGVLVPMERQVERLRAVRQASESAGVSIVINARTDVFIREAGEPESRLEEGIRRGKAYLAAGADCIYPIGLTDADAIRTFVTGGWRAGQHLAATRWSCTRDAGRAWRETHQPGDRCLPALTGRDRASVARTRVSLREDDCRPAGGHKVLPYSFSRTFVGEDLVSSRQTATSHAVRRP